MEAHTPPESGHRLGMLLQILRAGHHGGHNQLTASVQIVPLLSDIQGGTDLALTLQDGGGGGGGRAA